MSARTVTSYSNSSVQAAQAQAMMAASASAGVLTQCMQQPDICVQARVGLAALAARAQAAAAASAGPAS